MTTKATAKHRSKPRKHRMARGARGGAQDRRPTTPLAGSAHVTRPGGNVFADLGFPADEAENLKMRARLMAELRDLIAPMTQVDAAELLAPGERSDPREDRALYDRRAGQHARPRRGSPASVAHATPLDGGLDALTYRWAWVELTYRPDAYQATHAAIEARHGDANAWTARVACFVSPPIPHATWAWLTR